MKVSGLAFSILSFFLFILSIPVSSMAYDCGDVRWDWNKSTCENPTVINVGSDLAVKVKIWSSPELTDANSIMCKLSSGTTIIETPVYHSSSADPDFGYSTATCVFRSLAEGSYSYQVWVHCGGACNDCEIPNCQPPKTQFTVAAATPPGTGLITPIQECQVKFLKYSTQFRPGDAGFWTELGCMPRKPEQFVVWFIYYVIPITGGIGLLVLFAGVFGLMTSGGNPEKVAKSQQLITAAVAGIFFIIISVYLLRTIGVNLFQIPGF